MKESYFWRAADVAQVVRCSTGRAYQLIRAWNKELSAKGFTTMSGRVPRQYAIDRLGLEARA